MDVDPNPTDYSVFFEFMPFKIGPFCDWDTVPGLVVVVRYLCQADNKGRCRDVLRNRGVKGVGGGVSPLFPNLKGTQKL